MKEQQVTICANCRHSWNKVTGSSVWYNWLCCHPSVERILGIDPVTGERGYNTKNDLGASHFTDEKRPYCRDINTGYCELYEE